MANTQFIPLSVPKIAGNEWEYVKECLDTGWISSVGSFVEKFEQEFARFVGARYAVASVNGTSALHIALLLAGVQRDDFVIMPNITFVATANAVRYANAEPILVDACPSTWQMDLDLLESFLAGNTLLNDAGECIHRPTGRCIRALLPVHVQGNIGNMDRLMEIAARFQLHVVEDAAECLGSTYKGRHGGTFGLLGCSSFNGNKIMSTGGGGMIFTDDEHLAARARHLTTTAKTDPLEYFHDEVGYNYRLVNILAAVGVAQLEQLPGFLLRKREVAAFYKDALVGIGDLGFQQILPEVVPNHWLFTIQTSRQKELLHYLNDNRILCRPFWTPMNCLPMYESCHYVSEQDNCARIHKTCLAIPCSTGISDSELEIVVREIKEFYDGAGAA